MPDPDVPPSTPPEEPNISSDADSSPERSTPPVDPVLKDADLEHALPDVPVARPVTVESLPDGGGDSATSLASSAARLSPGRAVLQLVLLMLAGMAGIILGSAALAYVPISDERWGHVLVMICAGVFCILAAFAMVRSAGQRASAIGWRLDAPGSDLAIGVMAAFGVYAAMMLAAMFLVLIRPELMERTGEAQKAIESTIPPTSIPVMILLMAFVALWEEVVFRGFLLTRLYPLLRRWWLAVILGAGIFSLGHGYQGPLATGVIGCVGVMLGFLFVWRRSLVAPVVFHMTFNLIGLLLLRSQSETWK